jgi:hypothetical protein
VLLDLEHELGFAEEGEFVLDVEGAVDLGELVGELEVHDGADDLDDFAFVHAGGTQY